MVTTSIEEDKKDYSSSEENLNYVDGKTQAKIARYGGQLYQEFQPRNAPEAGWIHEGIHRAANEVNTDKYDGIRRKSLDQLNVFKGFGQELGNSQLFGYQAQNNYADAQGFQGRV